VGDGRQVPVGFDELENGHMVTVAV
jgi:hypothetical protein